MPRKPKDFVPVQDLAGNLLSPENIGFTVDEQVSVKKRGRPKKYATPEEAKKAKIANTIASAKKRKGKGILDSVKNLADKVVDYGKAVIFGRDDYPPKVRKIISSNKDKVITGISLLRVPLGKPMMTALQIASGNTFAQKLKNTPYDKLFHLFICIDFAGKSITLEKNEVINSETNCKIPAETETKSITSSDIPSGLTLQQALDKTKERMGGKFFTYSAKDNNCQDFIVAFLQANNIGGATDTAWVKQNTKVLFEGNDTLRKIANTITDIGAKVNVITTGAGAQQSKPGVTEPVLEGDPVGVILDNLSDEDLVSLFGGLFSSRVAPNQTYRMPLRLGSMLIRLTEAQYARMRARVMALRQRLLDAPKITIRKKPGGGGGGKGKDLFGAKTGFGLKVGGGPSQSRPTHTNNSAFNIPPPTFELNSKDAWVNYIYSLMVLNEPLRVRMRMSFKRFLNQLLVSVEEILRDEQLGLIGERPTYQQGVFIVNIADIRDEVMDRFHTTTDEFNLDFEAERGHPVQEGRGIKRGGSLKVVGKAQQPKKLYDIYVRLVNYWNDSLSQSAKDKLDTWYENNMRGAPFKSAWSRSIGDEIAEFIGSLEVDGDEYEPLTIEELEPIHTVAGIESDADTSGQSSASSSDDDDYGSDESMEGMGLADSFSKQLLDYNRTHKPKLDLHTFAMKILANPKKFNKKIISKARIYINSILKKGSGIKYSNIVKSMNTPVDVSKFGVNKVMKEDYQKQQREMMKQKSAEAEASVKSGAGVKGGNPWINYVKAYANKNNMKYNEALKDPKMKAGYKKGGGDIVSDLIGVAKKVSQKAGEPYNALVGVNPATLGYDLGYNYVGPAVYKGIYGKAGKRGGLMPTSKDEIVAQQYDQSNLGANGKVYLN